MPHTIFVTCESSLIYCMPFICHLVSCIWWCSKCFFFLLTCHHLAHVTASSIILHIIVMYIIACYFIWHLVSYIWWCSKHFHLFFCTCHHLVHVTASSIILHIIVIYIIACCFIYHCAHGGVVNFSSSPYTPPSCTFHLIIIIFYCLLSLYKVQVSPP